MHREHSILRTGHGVLHVGGHDRAAAAILAVVFGVMAVVFRSDANGALMMAVMGVFMVLIGVVMGPGIIALTVRGKKNPQVLQLLEGLRSTHGGELSLPSMTNPAGQPRLVTSLQAIPLEISVLRLQSSAQSVALMKMIEGPHARSDARVIGGRLRLQVKLGTRVPFKLSMVSRSALSGLGAGVAGVREVLSGNPDLDARYAIYSDQPERAMAALRQADIWSACEGLLTVAQPFITQVGFGPEKALWGAPLTSTMTADTVRWIIHTMHGVSERLQSA